jgi:transcriptional regulator with XRE-family HTH domain
MSTLGDRVDAAIRASGKTADEIARTLHVDKNTVSRIRTGKEDNPKLQVLIGIAREVNTTVGALLGETITFSPADERELLRFRGWIDEKLATIDASQEPNAVILQMPPTLMPVVRANRVADRPRKSPPVIDNPFNANVHLTVRAVGESMSGAGILAGDTLYAIAAGPGAAASEIGKIVVCRLDGRTFVKRLVKEHRRLFLLSAHPRYRAIAVDAETLSFEILGTVIGRVGRVE